MKSISSSNYIITIGDICQNPIVNSLINEKFGNGKKYHFNKIDIGYGALQRAIEILNSHDKNIDIDYNIEVNVNF